MRLLGPAQQLRSRFRRLCACVEAGGCLQNEPDSPLMPTLTSSAARTTTAVRLEAAAGLESLEEAAELRRAILCAVAVVCAERWLVVLLLLCVVREQLQRGVDSWQAEQHSLLWSFLRACDATKAPCKP